MKIPNYLLLFLLVLAAKCACFGQAIAQDSSSYEYKIGLNFSFAKCGILEFYPINDFEETFDFGLSFSKKVKNKIFIESGINLEIKKALLFINLDSISGELVYKTFDIRVPILFRLETKSIYIRTGPYVDFYIQDEPVSYYFSEYDQSKVILGFCAYIGLEKQLTEAFSLYIDGGFAQDISKALSYKSGNPSGKYLSYGINFGTNFNF